MTAVKLRKDDGLGQGAPHPEDAPTDIELHGCLMPAFKLWMTDKVFQPVTLAFTMQINLGGQCQVVESMSQVMG